MAARKKGLWIWTVIFWGVFGAIQMLRVHDAAVAGEGFLTGAFAGLLLMACLLVLESRKEVTHRCRTDQWSVRRCYLTALLLILVLWLPAYLALFPGTFGYDGPEQFAQYMGTVKLTSHHPLAHTWLLGGLIELGNDIFGSYEAGLALYSAFQGIVTAGILAYSVVFLKERKVPGAVLLLCILWLSVNPVLQVLVFSTTKDVLFGDFLLLFSLRYTKTMEACLRPEPDDIPVKDLVILAVSGTLMCLFRNQGIYIILAMVILLLIMNARRLRKKKYRVSAAVMLLPVVITVGFNAFSADVLDIPKGNAREMYSVPIQQAANLAARTLDGADLLTEEELRQVMTVIPKEGLEAYTANSADPVKATFDTETFNKDRGKYIKLWLKLAMEHPADFVYTAADLEGPYFDMTQNQYRGLSLLYVNEETISSKWGIHADSKFPLYKNYLTEAVVNYRFRYIPIVGGIFEAGYIPWLWIVVLGWAVFMKNRTVFHIQLAAGLYFLTALLGPIALLRYMFPLIVMVPCFLGSFFIHEA